MQWYISVQESVHYFKYKQGENVLYEYADDIAPRHLTATLPLDYDTVAAADKFGNLFVTRLPPDVSSQVSLPLCPVHGRYKMLSSTCFGCVMLSAGLQWDHSFTRQMLQGLPGSQALLQDSVMCAGGGGSHRRKVCTISRLTE